VNIEPSPLSFRRFLEQRPQDLNLNVAASDSDGELVLYEIDDHGINGMTTLELQVAQAYRERGLPIAEKRVPVRTVRGLVEEYDLEAPDFLSVDVESHEGEVLTGIDLDHWRPKLIVVESTVPGSPEPNYQTWEPILLGHGYHFQAFNGLNRFYLREDLSPLAYHFDTPVNVFDSFSPHAVARLERELARREALLIGQCRHLESQRDDLGAQVDQLLAEVDRLRAALAAQRDAIDANRTATLKVAG
jgi:FkbM family methyltransferase